MTMDDALENLPILRSAARQIEDLVSRNGADGFVTVT